LLLFFPHGSSGLLPISLERKSDRMKRILLTAALMMMAATAAPLAAQQTAADSVKAVILRTFDGMRAGDSTMVRSAIAPGTTLTSVMVRDGKTVTRSGSMDGFIQAVGTPHDQVWDERVSNFVVHVDGPLAHAWMNYTFYAGDRLSHCGVNSIQLIRGDEGWKITSITDTRRNEGCPALPPGSRGE
jgi:hypothetical protein